MEQENNQKKLAVLIDAENTQASIIEALLAEIAKYGVASVRRIYGDWTTTLLRGWKDVLLEHAIQPIQQFRYTVGKNASDTKPAKFLVLLVKEKGAPIFVPVNE